MMKLRKLLFTCALVLTALLCLCALPQQAQAATESDLTFKLNPDGNSYTVSDCKTSAQGALEIPATYQGIRVTGIGDYAFDFCSSLTSVTIPYGVTSIGESAFHSCSSLTTVTIGRYVTSIGNSAFHSCSSLTSVTIGDGVTSIGDYAFYGCSSLPSVVIPGCVTSIGNRAFRGCSSLTSVTIPDSVTKIGEYAFFDCSSLTTVTIGNRVTSIGDYAFTDCSSLVTVTIGNRVTSIGNYAFRNCSSLTSVVIPNRVTSIGHYAFFDCSSLTGIWVDKSNPNYSSDSFGVLFDRGKTELIQAPGALSGAYTVPDSVTEIGNDAFCSCSSLTSVTIPDSVTSIGNWAFDDCSSLTSVTIGNNVTSIGYCTFRGCSSLTSVTIPDSVTEIGEEVFFNCSSLTSVTIPDSVTRIGRCAFYFCSSLTAVTIPDSVTTIDVEAFEYCDSLTSVTIGNSVTSIGESAFYFCSSLTAVTIPDSVTSIEHNAFSGCSSLNDVYYGGTEAQWAQISIDEYNECLTNATIHFNTRSVSDVNLSSWQFLFVQYALERNLMAGKGTDAHGRIKFDPNSPITREEFVQVLYNAEGKPAVSIANPFPDVKDNGWYKNAVLWAKKNDIANGGGDGNFGVGAKITRQDLALMLYKYATLKNCSLEAEAGITDQYGDKDKISGYAKTAMDWAVTNGILSGKGVAGQPLSTFRLDPAGIATRAECAAMLKNFMTAFGL